MKKIAYILFYVFLIFYEILAMNRIVARQLATEAGNARLPLLACFNIAGLVFISLSKKTVSQSSFGKSFVIFYVYLLVMSVLNGLMHGFERKIAFFEYTLPFVCFFVEFYAQYDLGLKKFRRILVLVCFVILSVNYLINYRLITTNIGESIVGTNSSYFLLYLTPLLCVVTNQKNHKYIFIIVALMVLLATKRGEAIGLMLGIIVYIYIRLRQSNTVGKFAVGRFILILVSIGVILLIFNFIINLNLYNGILLERLMESTEDEGSGRLDIYNASIALIESSDFIGHVIGHGYNAVKYQLELSAHNDFLEIIYDFGWICCLLFVVFIIKGFVWTFKHHDLNIRPILGLSFSFFIVCALVSIIVCRVYYLNLLALFWGAASGIPKDFASLSKEKDSTHADMVVTNQ